MTRFSPPCVLPPREDSPHDQAAIEALLDDLAQDLAEIAGLASYPESEAARRLARVLVVARRAERRLRNAQDGAG
jgi:cob(I)alamin adenosyltransferase